MDEYLIHGPEQHEGVIIGLKLLQNGYDKVADTGLLTAIESIGREQPETKFLFYGDLSELQRKIILNPDQKIYIPARDNGDWQKTLSTIDLGLIPLAGTEDDRVGRFDALEYMLMKIPWVASEGTSFCGVKAIWMAGTESCKSVGKGIVGYGWEYPMPTKKTQRVNHTSLR